MIKRPLCMVAAGMALGIALSGACGRRKLVAVLVCSAVCMIFWAVRQIHKRRPYMAVLLFPAWVFLGICCMNRAQEAVREVPAVQKEAVVLRGTVYDRQTKKDKTVYYLENVIFVEQGENSVYSICTDDAKSNYQGTCIAYYEGEQQVSIGSTIYISGKISLLQKATNKGQFDALSYYRSQGIDFSIFQIEILGIENESGSFRERLCQVREYLHRRIEELAGEHAPVLQAMLLGEKGQMDEETKTLYQKSGISHVLVISGLHFSLIGMCFYHLLRRFGCSFRTAGMVSMVWLFLYGVMTGFGVSAVRAFVMFAISVGAQMLGREYDLASALGAAVCILLAGNPFVLFQAGFLLSVGAVLGILLIIPAIEAVCPVEAVRLGKDMSWKERLWMEAEKGWHSVLKGMLSGIGIQVGTLPVLLYFFYECAPYSIVLNCIVLPLLPIVILGAVASVAVSFFVPSLAELVMMPPVWVLDVYEGLCRCFGKFPGAQLVTGQPKLWQIVLYYVFVSVVLIGIWLWKQDWTDKGGLLPDKLKSGKKRLWSFFLKKQERSPAGFCLWKHSMRAAGMFLYMSLFYVLFVWRDTEGLDVTMLDVGQGQAVYIRSGKNDVLYDGGSTDVSQVGKYRIAPFLKASGVERLDLVIVSHMDADHYNGVEQLLEENLIEIRCLMLPELVETDESYERLRELALDKGVHVETVSMGEHFSLEETVCEVLHPSVDYRAEDKNDTSIVLRLSYRDFTMMLTGDVESGGEEHMLEAGVLEDVDVLQVAHHGSDSSSTVLFLEAVSAETALISCGAENSYGHPAPETMQKLYEAGCETHVTMEEGSISMHVE